MLSSPLVVEKEIIGILDVFREDIHMFTEIEIKQFECFSNYAALSFERATNKDAKKLEKLTEIMLNMINLTEIEDIQQCLLEGALELVSLGHESITSSDLIGEVSRLNYYTGELEIRKSNSNSNIQKIYDPLKLGKGFTGKALQERTIKRISDVLTPDARDIYVMHWETTRSEIAIPIYINNSSIREETEPSLGSKLIGVLNIESPEIDTFAQTEEKYLELLSDYAAILMDRIEYNQKLAELSRKEQEIVNAETLDEIMEIVMDLQDSINKQLISAEMREILNDNPELSREVKDLLHNQVERKLKERQLLSPENSNELWQAIAWFSQRGDKQDLFLIRLAKDLSTYEVDLSFEKVLKDIENRAFEASDSQIYQLYGSEVKIKESLPKEIAIIESYDFYSFIIVDAKNIQQIHNLRETYPWMDVSEDYTQRVIANNEHIMTYQKEQIVKFRYPVRQEWKQRLTNAGAQILKPLGGFEFVVSIPDIETLSQIQQFREVASIYPYQPTIRVNEESLENLGAEVTPEMMVEVEQKITESYPVSSHRDNVIIGILIARFLTDTDCDKAAQTLEDLQIDIVDRPDIDMLIVDLLQHQNPKEAYEFLKSLSGLDTLEEETLATTLNSSPVPLLAKGPTMFEHIPNNLTGNGEIIAIADTGLDTGYE
ncbi:MAG: hypothetical protein RLZZ148_2574, partial [Cyanobacteriota bacterium]